MSVLSVSTGGIAPFLVAGRPINFTIFCAIKSMVIFLESLLPLIIFKNVFVIRSCPKNGISTSVLSVKRC